MSSEADFLLIQAKVLMQVHPLLSMESILLAGGCFWCIETIFNELRGVESAVSGYSGGHVENPTYEAVCSGRTGHAEVVKVTFDPKVISLREILEIFFTMHDPTTLNRQGNDVGTQYRSAVFYANEEQKKTTEEVISEFEQKGIWKNKIVTEVSELGTFYPAEDYHQNYFNNNKNSNMYCKMVVEPKVIKFRKKFFDRLKK